MCILNVLRLKALKIASSIQFYIEVIEVPWGNWSVFHAINWMFNGIWILYLLIAIMINYIAFIRLVSCQMWSNTVTVSRLYAAQREEEGSNFLIFRPFNIRNMLFCVLPQFFSPLFLCYVEGSNIISNIYKYHQESSTWQFNKYVPSFSTKKSFQRPYISLYSKPFQIESIWLYAHLKDDMTIDKNEFCEKILLHIILAFIATVEYMRSLQMMSNKELQFYKKCYRQSLWNLFVW